MIILVYLVVPIAVLILWLCARNEEVPGEMNDGIFTMELYRLSLFIYRKIPQKKRGRGTEKIRAYLAALNEHRNMEQLEAEYYAHKISLLILMLIAGSFLSLVLHLTSVQEQLVKDGMRITRNSPGGGEQIVELTASDEDGNQLGEYSISVEELKFSEAEASELFDRACLEMEKVALADNASFDEVRNDLKLIKKLDGFPFDISWESTDYSLINQDGTIEKENIPDDGAVITLTATYKYDGNKWRQEISVRLLPPLYTAEETLRLGISSLLDEYMEKTRYENEAVLPQRYEDMKIVWNEKKEDDSIILMLLMMIGGAVSFVLKDKELQANMEKRDKALFMEYPGFVSQLVLYLGAGMPVRNIFVRLSEDYLRKRKIGGEVKPTYEELVKAARELNAGKSELQVYESFGARCGRQEYTRLCALLSQNLRKGNGELLSVLREESKKAFDERLDNVRKMGEEAGTKLLLPMILMLLIVMVVIMIPAYMSF